MFKEKKYIILFRIFCFQFLAVAKIIPCEKSHNSQFAEIHTKYLKAPFAKIKPHES